MTAVCTAVLANNILKEIRIESGITGEDSEMRKCSYSYKHQWEEKKSSRITLGTRELGEQPTLFILNAYFV